MLVCFCSLFLEFVDLNLLDQRSSFDMRLVPLLVTRHPQLVQGLLNGVDYTEGAAKTLCGRISEEAIKGLAALKLPYKFFGAWEKKSCITF